MNSDASLTYYVYISDSKVDMLLPQIPEGRRSKIAAELKLDLKIVSLTYKSDAQPLSNRISRLRVVEKYLRERSWVGGIGDEPEYISDAGSVSWGILQQRGRGDQAVAFSMAEGNQELLMIGSTHHVIGAVPNATPVSASPYYYTMALLQSLNQGDADGALPRQPMGTASDPFHAVCQARSHMLDNRFAAHYPVQRLQFLAKRYATKGGVTVGSPLFVSMID